MTTASCARAAWIEDVVRDQCFAIGYGTLSIGAELELLAFDRDGHAPARIHGGSLALVRAAGAQLGWHETISDKGVPRFASAHGGALTFEPGGQLEYASSVHRSVDGLLGELCRVEATLRECAEQFDVDLLACGIDPFNGPECAPLQLFAPRYEQMARYFASIGADGARMMRQTASLQINIGGISALERWSVANALAAWLVALFANSSRYAGKDTGFASYRAETWRGVDAGRTGIFDGADPVREYASFARTAAAFLAADPAVPFDELDDALRTPEALSAHLTTLFPEVRPRGYLEVRSLDAIGGADRTAAMAFVVGILGDAAAARDAADLLGPADDALLRRAGRDGMNDARIASVAGDLMTIALRGCERLGPTIVGHDVYGVAQTRLSEALQHAVAHSRLAIPFHRL